MPDLPSVTNFINSPPGQFSAGTVLAGVVWKVFERVEAVLTDQTKFEIAVWLVGVKTADKVPWPETFTKIFDRVFGPNVFSVNCFLRSCIATLVNICVFPIAWFLLRPKLWGLVEITLESIVGLTVLLLLIIFVDFLMLIKTRIALRFLYRTTSNVKISVLTLADMIVGFYVGGVESLFIRFFVASSVFIGGRQMALFVLKMPGNFPVGLALIMGLYPAIFTSVWLWLYAGSGFLLKFARRFDLGFDWFSRHADIEKKPLSAIGLIAGSLVAILYWSWAVFRHFVPA